MAAEPFDLLRHTRTVSAMRVSLQVGVAGMREGEA
jgi:hypothetical protein